MERTEKRIVRLEKDSSTVLGFVYGTEIDIKNFVGDWYMNSGTDCMYYKKFDPAYIEQRSGKKVLAAKTMAEIESKIEAATPKSGTIADLSEEPATERQMWYLQDILHVVITRPISKKYASMVIDSIKSGEGVGSFGLFFEDGSN